MGTTVVTNESELVAWINARNAQGTYTEHEFAEIPAGTTITLTASRTLDPPNAGAYAARIQNASATLLTGRLWPVYGSPRSTIALGAAYVTLSLKRQASIRNLQLTRTHADAGAFILGDGASIGASIIDSGSSTSNLVTTATNGGSVIKSLFVCSATSGYAVEAGAYCSLVRCTIVANGRTGAALRSDYGDLQVIGTAISGFSTQLTGTLASGSTHNATNSGSQLGTSGQVSLTTADFLNTTGGSQDYKPASGSTKLLNTGTTTAWFTTDIFGTSIPQGASPDIGAIELSVGATGTTLSGPSSGGVGVASTDFTVGVTPGGGAITGTLVVTPGDAADGGTFTPTSVNLTTGSPTATFTYTPASVGAKTIGITDDGGLTDATPLTYTASVLAPTINTQPTAQAVSEGAAATYTIAATASSGSLSYQWKRQEPAGGAFANVGTNSTSYTTGALACATDNGATIRCDVTDSNGTTNSNAVGLTVRSTTTTSRPVADVSGAGWTASTGTDLFALIDETTASSTDYIESPTITGTAAWVVVDLGYELAAGERMVSVQAWVPGGTGTLKTELRNDAGTVVGTPDDQAVTGTATVYDLPVTLSGVATRLAFAFTT